MSLNDSIVEDAALEWFGELDYAVWHGPAYGWTTARRAVVAKSAATQTEGRRHP